MGTLFGLTQRMRDNLQRSDSVMTPVETAFFILALAFVRLAYGGYSFGLSDSIDHLPIVYRFMDAGYLTKDFRVNVGASFDPRYYYAHVLAAFARVLPLPIVSVALTFLAQAGIALATVVAAKTLFKGSRLAVVGAAVLVMVVDPFYGMDDLVYSYLKPSLLARAFGYGALAAGLKRRPLLAACLCFLGGFWHPTLALEVGAFALLVAFTAFLVDRRVLAIDSARFRRAMLEIAAAACILAAHAVVFWALPYRSSLSTFQLDTRQFLQIMLFRHEYTTVPSSFSLRYYAGGVAFLALSAVSWLHWHRDAATDRAHSLSVLVFTLGVLLFCVGGYVFVEIFPSRLWVTVRAFRMLHAVKWIGMLVICGSFAQARRWDLWAAAAAATVLLSAVAGDVLVLPLILGAVFAVLALWQPRAGRRLPRFLLPGLLLALAVVDTCLSFPLPGWLAVWRPRITLEADDDISRYARTRTPADAVFLTPPDYGLFRLTAHRAIIVDWKSAPFQDSAMREWWNRMNECYAVVSGMKRNEGLELMEAGYRRISADKLLRLRDKYGADFAVLHVETPVSFPILARTAKYKLVSLTP